MKKYEEVKIEIIWLETDIITNSGDTITLDPVGGIDDKNWSQFQ